MMNRARALKWCVNNLKEWPECVEVMSGNPPSIKEINCCWVVTWESIGDGLQKQATIRMGDTPTFGKICDELRITKQDWQSALPAPASNKPSWDDAPEEAQSLSQDADGSWTFCTSTDIYPHESAGAWFKTDGGAAWIFPKKQGGSPNPNWRDTLEHRPVVKESLSVQDKQDDVLQYVPKNLARIKQLNDEIEMAKFSIDTMQIELAERNKEVQDVLNYCKFNA